MILVDLTFCSCWNDLLSLPTVSDISLSALGFHFSELTRDLRPAPPLTWLTSFTRTRMRTRTTGESSTR